MWENSLLQEEVQRLSIQYQVVSSGIYHVPYSVYHIAYTVFHIHLIYHISYFTYHHISYIWNTHTYIWPMYIIYMCVYIHTHMCLCACLHNLCVYINCYHIWRFYKLNCKIQKRKSHITCALVVSVLRLFQPNFLNEPHAFGIEAAL